MFEVDSSDRPVDLTEIESAMGRCLGVRQAAVGRHTLREGDTRLVAYVVLDSGFLPHVGSLRAELVAALPAHAVPSTFLFLDDMPSAADGTIDRGALRVPDPEVDLPPLRAARSDMERVLCSLFAEVLGLPIVGIDDNFFEAGGDSLTATVLIRRIQEEAGLPLVARDLFAAPSVAELADQLARHPTPARPGSAP